jgi:hypothetical protein
MTVLFRARDFPAGGASPGAAAARFLCYSPGAMNQMWLGAARRQMKRLCPGLHALAMLPGSSGR